MLKLFERFLDLPEPRKPEPEVKSVTYDFTPQEDMTAYELAVILSNTWADGASTPIMTSEVTTLSEIDPGRHFTRRD